MIKVEIDSVSMRGNTPVLVMELALAMKSLRESLAKRYGEVATEELITLPSTSAISLLRCSGEKRISSGSISFSFNRRIVSTISQLDTFLGWLPSATEASKISARCLEPVMISISYSGISYSSL